MARRNHGRRIDVGPFTLRSVRARGGMGEVWDAVHAERGLPVAVKVLTEEGIRQPHLIEAIHREVRAMAALDHPHIVWIHDMGIIDREASRAAGGSLPEGSPWFAMEHADGGSLDSWIGGSATTVVFDLEEQPPPTADAGDALTWTGVDRVLHELLEALGHAHARGVLHRDIKAANILFSLRAGRAPQLKLTDFGMVYDTRRQKEGLPGGTPGTMAPEQVLGRAERQGPWTDLYAVGCLAWELITGELPFIGPIRAILRAQCDDPLPAFRPTLEVPAHVEPWLRRLLEKEPLDRFQRAADAAGALSKQARSGVPPDWRSEDVRLPSVQLLGTGMRLFGLRTVPLAGRTGIRDTLWSALRDTASDRQPRRILLDGGPGVGKSRLAEWLGQRAHEVGAAEVFVGTHASEEGGPSDGLRSLLRRELRITGMSGPDARARALARLGSVPLPPGDLAGLLAIALPGEPAVEERERHGALMRWIETTSAGRVVLLWLDEVQWGPESLRFLDRVLAPALPVLAVLTVRGDLPSAGDVRRQVADAGGMCLEIGPLPRPRQAELVRNLLCLAPGLAAEVEERAGGNPLFAVQLVAAWIEHGVLEAGPEGFAPRPGVELRLPSSLAGAAIDRVTNLEADHPTWRAPLEIAAALGHDLDAREWMEACSAAGLDVTDALLQALGDAGVLRRHVGTSHRWAFAHGVVREAVLTRAETLSTLAAAHRACASVLDPGDEPFRVGRHLLLGDRGDEALPLLWKAQRHLYDIGDYSRRLWILDRIIEFLEGAGRSDDPLIPRSWLAASPALAMRGRMQDALDRCERAFRWAEDHDDGALLMTAIQTRAAVQVFMGDVPRGVAEATEGLRLASRLGVPPRETRSLRARLAEDNGRLGRYPVTLALAIELMEETEVDDVVTARAAFAAARACSHLDRWAECERYAIRGIELTRVLRQPLMEADFERLLGDVDIHRGDLDQALARFESTRRVYEDAGSPFLAIAEEELGHLHLRTGDVDRARVHLERALALAERAERPHWVQRALLGLIQADATDVDRVIAWLDRIEQIDHLEVIPGAQAPLTEAEEAAAAVGHDEVAARIRALRVRLEPEAGA